MSDTAYRDTDAPHLILIGNGSAHLHVAAHADRLIAAGARVTLIGREDFWFTDWLGGMLGGEWQIEDLRLSAELIESRGGTRITGEVERIDRTQRTLALKDGRRLHYDWLSIDIPAVIDAQRIPGFYTTTAVFSPQPLDLWKLRQRLETQLAAEAEAVPGIAVIGGGAASVEFAANLLALGERYGRNLPVTLVSDDRQLLPDAPRRANRWLGKRLQRRGLRLELVAKASRYENHRLILDDGSALEVDYLLVADTGRASPWLENLELEEDVTYGISADDTLRCREDPRLFVTGCNRSKKSSQPCSDREQAACLLDNLLRSIHGDAALPCGSTTNTAHWKALNLGDLRDIAWRTPLWCRGRWVRRLKHRRDRRRLLGYRSLTLS